MGNYCANCGDKTWNTDNYSKDYGGYLCEHCVTQDELENKILLLEEENRKLKDIIRRARKYVNKYINDIRHPIIRVIDILDI